jgi:hypothetical protein
MSQLGLGVMIQSLGGNEETVKAIKESLGKHIVNIVLESDSLAIHFEDKTVLYLQDEGQSCCEHRYMTTDDDLSEFCDSQFMDVELADGENKDDEYGEHEIQFLNIKTSKGTFQMANHNEHNGYYGGFWITATITGGE